MRIGCITHCKVRFSNWLVRSRRRIVACRIGRSVPKQAVRRRPSLAEFAHEQRARAHAGVTTEREIKPHGGREQPAVQDECQARGNKAPAVAVNAARNGTGTSLRTPSMHPVIADTGKVKKNTAIANIFAKS